MEDLAVFLEESLMQVKVSWGLGTKLTFFEYEYLSPYFYNFWSMNQLMMKILWGETFPRLWILGFFIVEQLQ